MLNREQIEGFEVNGFTVFPQSLDQQTVEALCLHLGDNSHAQRNLLDVPIVRNLAVSQPVKQTVATLLGRECFAVRGILFNKTPNMREDVKKKQLLHCSPWDLDRCLHPGPFFFVERVLVLTPVAPQSTTATRIAVAGSP